MSINIFLENILKKISKTFREKSNSGSYNFELDEINNEDALIKDVDKIEVENNIGDNEINKCKINKKFSTVDEYSKFIEKKCKEKISLFNFDIQVWYKFNQYSLSKFTKERINDFEEIFYEVIQEMQNYFDENNISMLTRWFDNNFLKNDISFIIRYCENLLRYNNENKRLLSYEKFKDINLLRIYLDNKFENIINKRLNEISSNIPEMLFDLEIDDYDIKENTFDIKNLEKQKLIDELNEDIANTSDNIILEENLIVDTKELENLIDDIDNFEI